MSAVTGHCCYWPVIGGFELSVPICPVLLDCLKIRDNKITLLYYPQLFLLTWHFSACGLCHVTKGMNAFNVVKMMDLQKSFLLISGWSNLISACSF